MDVFISKHQEQIKQAITTINQYDRSLKSLSSWWQRVSLIGKINSLEVASTILGDMESALNQFHKLQQRLIENLVKEHARKILIQDQSRCQMAIDVLIRNLFERTADIGFLATDQDVLTFLKKEVRSVEDVAFLKQNLQAYVDIYSVYQDAILLDSSGELLFQLSQPNSSATVTDAFIQQALNRPDSYVEYFGTTSLINDSKSHLLYANAVMDEGEVMGVIVLCFRFQNELEAIVENLSSEEDQNHFLLLDAAGKVLFSPANKKQLSPNRFSLKAAPEMVVVNNIDVIKICSKGQAYQGYAGPENWHMSSLLPLSVIEGPVNNESKNTQESRPPLKDLAGLISEELFHIRHLSTTINGDLELIVLNGIITAARKEANEFVPVLEAIRNIGRDIDTVFADSIESLFSTIISGQLESIRLQADLAVDIMDRNLYERANDCRWWGLNTQLQHALSSTKVDSQIIKQILAKIHSLYTVYHTLYVYDSMGRYVAFSDEDHEAKLGQMVESDSGAKSVHELHNIYQYSVSPFVPFDCYDGAYTYIYNAAIRESNQSEKIVGGIGIVFDSTAEFKAILTDILPKENGVVKAGSKALFTQEDGRVIASTSDDHPIGSMFSAKIDRHKLMQDGDLSTLIRLDGRVYILSAAVSKGYREYKREDGYENTIIAWVLVPC